MLCLWRNGALLWRNHKNVSIYKTHKSLDKFCKKCPSRIGERILLYIKDYQKGEVVTCNKGVLAIGTPLFSFKVMD